MMQKIILGGVAIIILAGAGAFYVWSRGADRETGQNTSNSNQDDTPLINEATSMSDTNTQIDKLAVLPIAEMKTNYGTMKIQFYTAEAPELTKNFIELAQSGYYNGLTFHRIIPGFVAQGGDPLGTGTGGHSYKGEGEGLADEAGALALKHLPGAIAWAKSSLPNSIGSQFYFALDNLTQLDGGYSVFGQMVEGLDVLEKIGAVETNAADKPVQPVTIESVTISQE
ncbi:MAG: peptidylprolyl isomerase [bacterium]|nr:peptidylprolyl isomerase [bacterium]